MLDQATKFFYKNYSVPKDDPIHTNGTKKELRDAISEKIRNSHVILVMGGVYSSYSKWINIEIEIAKKDFNWKKPIIVIKPRGTQRTSTHVKENANKIVGWNTQSIVNSIREFG